MKVPLHLYLLLDRQPEHRAGNGNRWGNRPLDDRWRKGNSGNILHCFIWGVSTVVESPGLESLGKPFNGARIEYLLS